MVKETKQTIILPQNHLACIFHLRMWLQNDKVAKTTTSKETFAFAIQSIPNVDVQSHLAISQSNLVRGRGSALRGWVYRMLIGILMAVPSVWLQDWTYTKVRQFEMAKVNLEGKTHATVIDAADSLRSAGVSEDRGKSATQAKDSRAVAAVLVASGWARGLRGVNI